MDTNGQNDSLDKAKSQASNDIFAAMGAADIPEEEKGALLARMMDLVQSRALLKIVDKLNEEEKGKLESLMEGNEPDPGKVESFLVETVPEYEQIFMDEAKRLRQELTIEFAE